MFFEPVVESEDILKHESLGFGVQTICLAHVSMGNLN